MIDRGIYTIKIHGQDYSIDLDLPLDVTTNNLIEMILDVFSKLNISLNKNKNYKLVDENSNKSLVGDSTLISQQLWEGATLVLV